MDKSTFVEVWEASKEVSAHCWRKKKSEIRCIEEDKGNSFILSTLLLPQEGTTQCQGRPSWPDNFSHRGKWKCESECLTSSSMWYTSNEAHSVSSHPEHWGELHDWGADRGQENRQGLGISKGHRSINCFCRLHQKAHQRVTGDASPVDYPIWPMPSLC